MKAMSKANTLAVDFTKAKDVLQILPNGSLLTSRGAQWDGIYLEYYRHPPYEIPENFPKQHLILINTRIPPSTHYEQALDGRISSDELRQGEVIVIPANILHWARWDAEHDYITLSLDPTIFNRYAAQLFEVDDTELVPHLATSDPLIYGLGLALKTELELDGLGGRLYTDSLTSTLFTHLLRHYCARKNSIPTYTGGLSKSQLRQAIEYIHNHLEQDLTLAELAAVVRMSPNYFASLFKQSIGLTPHQYVIGCRVEAAKHLLRQRELTIAEIAFRLGFAHQSHFNHHFKRLVGVTPKRFLTSQ
ncbi:MAG: HTH-type transcriptional activator RhaS [Chroococcidiopsis cubana SAG 39.79]|uniref:AraC family transcriptional regulator n=2 Tax=Chroococcidiopsis TaxID=54298 RepID=A0AB37U913_9CYAN|nr:helix-turn-helix domain-containing protein [Chroococcidiopsis cubana]MDZ4877103.1 HTH-type transcriptional activator RhaS [Chroococcidiopsis cubana SAG 39.79]RUS98436.1 AraC family transcriptional regulator [Chroococcidiopsis cubana SAG 39.79]